MAILPFQVSANACRADIDSLNGLTFAIQNVGSGKDLRPFNASREEGNAIVLYNHHWWQCLTWRFTEISAGHFELSNVYTGKLLHVDISSAGMGTIIQRTGSPSSLSWEMVPQPGEVWGIRLSGTRLFITITSVEKNAPVTLSPFINSDSQKWRFIPQHPWL